MMREDTTTEEKLRRYGKTRERHAGDIPESFHVETGSGAETSGTQSFTDPSENDVHGTGSLDHDTKKQTNQSRLKEIRDVLHRNHITRGISPQKLRIILEELGPTYIKLGQIMSMHSDILPKEYCDELMKLNSDVDPMPFSVVEEVINRSWRCDWRDYLEELDEKPLGSASIAQVHRAVLKNGEEVVVKVQRKGIYDTMSRDIGLLHRAVHLMPPIGDLKNVVDFDMVLDEMWKVAQEEMDFLKEASNMDEFARNNKDIKYVRVPHLYREYTTSRVLVMEYIDGCAIDDKTRLEKEGYDLNEIGEKYVNNFLKQVMDDGFFHADPHPGNVKICDGQIVWIDMGMMGRLSEHDRKVMVKGVEGLAMHDITTVENAVLEIGDFQYEPDRGQLYNDLKKFVKEYGSVSMGDVDVAETMQVLLDIMKRNGIKLPHGVTMLCRGLTHVEGVLATIAPDINMMQIAATRVQDSYLKDFDWKGFARKNGRMLLRSLTKGAEIPALANDALKEYLDGQGKFNLYLHTTQALDELVYSSVRNLVIGICVAALLMASSILCTTQMKPQVLGIPLVGLIGFGFALFVSIFLVVRNLYHKFRSKKPKKRKLRRKH